MNELLIGLLLILTFVYGDIVNKKFFFKTRKTFHTFPEVQKTNSIPKKEDPINIEKISTDSVKKQIIKIYHTEQLPNKRETIVNLLRYLCRYEDTGDFLDNNPNIQSFIFG